MKMLKIVDKETRGQDTDYLQKVLLDRVIKLRKLQKEMNENVAVQKAQDALELAKLPFKKARSKWVSEIEAIELELKAREIKYNIRYDDIFEE